MAEVSSIRQAFNKVYITGILEEKDIKIEQYEFINDSTGEKFPANRISGTITLDVKGSKIKVSLRANELTKTGAPNGMFAGYKTVMDEYITRAEAIVKGDESLASIVKVQGELNPYDKIDNRTFEVYTPMYIKGTFFNRGAITDEHKAEFITEIFVESVKAEETDGVPTGRTIIEGILPLYRGTVEPVKFVAGEDEKGNVGKFILKNYEAGKTYSVRGDIISTVTHKDYTREGMFGTETKTFESVKTEYWLNSGSSPKPYLITDPKAYDKNAIKAAMLYRQEKNDKKIAEERAKASGGYAHAPATATPFNSKIEPLTDEEVEAIEF